MTMKNKSFYILTFLLISFFDLIYFISCNECCLNTSKFQYISVNWVEGVSRERKKQILSGIDAYSVYGGICPGNSDTFSSNRLSVCTLKEYFEKFSEVKSTELHFGMYEFPLIWCGD